MSGDVIRTEQTVVNGTPMHYVIAVLRDDQLEAIRQIVREEVAAALDTAARLAMALNSSGRA